MLGVSGGFLSKILAMLFLKLCPQREMLAANLAYTPTAPGQVCSVRVEAEDPVSGEVLGQQDVSLTPQPQQVLLGLQQKVTCGLLRVVVTRLEGCTDPRGLRGISLEVMDTLNGAVLRTMSLQAE
jgi:hypothetical protein